MAIMKVRGKTLVFHQKTRKRTNVNILCYFLIMLIFIMSWKISRLHFGLPILFLSLLPLMCVSSSSFDSCFLFGLVVRRKRQGPFCLIFNRTFVRTRSPSTACVFGKCRNRITYILHLALLCSRRTVSRFLSHSPGILNCILRTFCIVVASWRSRSCSSYTHHFWFLLFPFIFKLNFNVWLCMYLFVGITFLMKLFNIL